LGGAWLLAEIGLRIAFDSLSPGAQGAIENVRVVPWDDGRIVPLPPSTGTVITSACWNQG
jgi:hypothetical protein